MSRLLALLREHRTVSLLVGGTLACDLLYYGLHDFGKATRAQSLSCTQPGSTDMLDISPGLHKLLRSAGDRLGLQPDLLGRVRVFVTRRADPVYLGRLSSSGLGAFLGLPEHYAYSPQDTEQRRSFYFDERPLSLNTKLGKQLYHDCLLLTDEEKCFVLARELAYLTSGATHALPVTGTLASGGLAATAYWLLHAGGRPLIQRLMGLQGAAKYASIILLGSTTVGAWGLMGYQWFAAYFKSLDARVDRRAATAFPAGAVGFYEKQVRRNVLLRTMLGESVGKGYFTVKGNEVGNRVLSDPFLPVNQRRSKLRYDQAVANRVSEPAAQ